MMTACTADCFSPKASSTKPTNPPMMMANTTANMRARIRPIMRPPCRRRGTGRRRRPHQATDTTISTCASIRHAPYHAARYAARTTVYVDRYRRSDQHRRPALHGSRRGAARLPACGICEVRYCGTWLVFLFVGRTCAFDLDAGMHAHQFVIFPVDRNSDHAPIIVSSTRASDDCIANQRRNIGQARNIERQAFAIGHDEVKRITARPGITALRQCQVELIASFDMGLQHGQFPQVWI
nr:MAG TPA: hypothetical protein [Caudoviricetes sp.]